VRAALGHTVPLAILLGSAAPAAAQAPVARDAVAQDTPAHLAYVDGSASLAREDDLLDAGPGHPIVAGDRLRTGSGRAEVWFPDGSTLALDAHTSLEWRSPAVLLLTGGQLILFVARQDDRDAGPGGPPAPSRFHIDTPAGSVVSHEPGEYRIALSTDRAEEFVELTVVRGAADLLGDGGSVAVRSGERAFGRLGSVPSYPQVALATRPDTFAQWALGRRDARLRRPAAVRHLPPNLQAYGSTFDEYGTWGYEGSYGYVWYPHVGVDWRPYYDGFWTPLRGYGWTWVGLDVWGWPTHHYGRWGHARGRWFWRPDRYWGPGWVSWAGAPGYVSWCPLGFDNRPVFSLAYGRAWDAWVVLPRSSFGRRGHHVNRYALAGHRVPRGTAFSLDHAPEPPAFRVRADRQASHGAGVAVRRTPQPRDAAGTSRPQWPGPPTRSPLGGDRTERASRRGSTGPPVDRSTSRDRTVAAGRVDARPRRPDQGQTSAAPPDEQWQIRGLPRSQWRTDDRLRSPEPNMRRWSSPWSAPERDSATSRPRDAVTGSFEPVAPRSRAIDPAHPGTGRQWQPGMHREWSSGSAGAADGRSAPRDGGGRPSGSDGLSPPGREGRASGGGERRAVPRGDRGGSSQGLGGGHDGGAAPRGGPSQRGGGSRGSGSGGSVGRSSRGR
jgi:hypothetical protein